MVYAGNNAINNTHINLVNSTGTTAGMVGIYANSGGNFTNNGNITGASY